MFKPQNILSERIETLTKQLAEAQAEMKALKTMGVHIALRHVVTNPNCTVFDSDEWAELCIANKIIENSIVAKEGI